MKYTARLAILLLMGFFLAVLPGFTVSNPWQNQHVWWIDENNGSGLALDSNNCATQTTPCLTMPEVIRRLGGPYTTLDTSGVAYVFHFMSSNVGKHHQIQFTPICGDNTLMAFEGVDTQVGSACTLSSVTNRNTAANAGTLPTISATCPTAAGQFITNATHPSAAYVKSGTSPNWTITQPLTRCDAATNTCPRTEVNNWAAGDTISVWTHPTIETDVTGCLNPAQSSGAFGYTHIQFSGGGNNIIGPYPAMWENSQASGAIVRMASMWGEIENYYQPPGSGTLIAWTPYPASPNVQFKGLVPSVEGGIFQVNSDMQGFNFGLGVDLEPGLAVAGTFTDAYLGPPGGAPAGNSVYIEPGPQNFIISTGSPPGFFWGPGSLNLMPGASLGYGPGLGATSFYNGASAIGGLGFAFSPGQANGLSPAGVWCATNVGGSNPVSTNCGISGTATNTETAWGSGGCGGNCWYPNGTSVSAFRLQ